MKDRMGNKLTTEELVYKAFNRFFNILLDFELMFLRWVGCIPFHTIRLFFYKISGVTIGKSSRIHMHCNFFDPRNIKIGEDTIIGNNAFLDGRAKLEIGNHVDIASQVMIYNSEHDVHAPDMRSIEEPVEIGDYVFVGPRAIILPGVKIGTGAVVAAGAVVTKNVPERAIVGGVPAKEIGQRQLTDFRYRLGRFRLFQ